MLRLVLLIVAVQTAIVRAEVHPSSSPHAMIVFVIARGSDALERHDLRPTDVREVAGTTRATATLRTPAGSVIEVVDRWTTDGDAHRLRRDVKVTRAVAGDVAFGTGAEFDAPAAALDQADVFVPGLWYGSGAQTPPSGLVHDVGQTDFLLREDRTALPLVSVRDRATGRTVTLAHDDPNGSTVRADDGAGRQIDARFRFGSIGLRRESGQPLRVAFRFPGSEGEQTSLGGFRPDRRTAERLHPIAAGATQHYELTLQTGVATDLAAQLCDAWRDAFARAAPAPVAFKPAAIYDASVGALAHYAYDAGDVSGIPFGVTLPTGEAHDRSLQMGFVGQQLPCAAYLIDDGLRTGRADRVAQGERIVDFWARVSLSPAGVPRTWYDVDPKPRFRDYSTFLRVVTDGASGALRAWQIQRTAGNDRPAWLEFCRAIGDWLVRVQNADGSFYRSWNFDGTPASKSLTSTLHPVRFLVDLSCATGDVRYRDAALRAATWSLAHDAPGRYVGGTPDNPDVLDKEAGWIAFDSYLSLYDVTGDRRWLDAAEAAATFTETWIYGWNVPMPLDAERLQMPRLRTTAGAGSLIATGHSGADLFLAYASLSFARLAIYTGDAHYADIARLLQANTAQFVDVDGSLGYATPGLCVEAFSLVAARRGTSVATWLPWCTSAILEPMARGREIFGTVEVAAALKRDAAELRRANATWAKTRGFAAPPTATP